MQSALWIFLSVAIGYGFLVLLMYLLQGQMVYHPQKTITQTPGSVGLPFENVTFLTEDKVSLHGWYIPTDDAKATVLYFHGNAGNISGRLQTIQLLHDLGLNVFIFDYRGYGESGGHPTEEGTYKDAQAAWDYLVSEKNVETDRIVIMGRSLGGAVASWLAARKNPAVTVLESTFTSAVDLGADLYHWLPVRWMMRFDYNTMENIKKIRSPIFMAHSTDDGVVPFHHGKALFDAAGDPKTFIELRGSHGSGFWETGEKYRSALEQFLNDNLEE